MMSKKHSRFTATHPKSTLSVLKRKDSTNTKISNIAVLREKIPLSNDNKHITSFKKIYDKLFSEFKEQMMQEYA